MWKEKGKKRQKRREKKRKKKKGRGKKKRKLKAAPPSIPSDTFLDLLPPRRNKVECRIGIVTQLTIPPLLASTAQESIVTLSHPQQIPPVHRLSFLPFFFFLLHFTEGNGGRLLLLHTPKPNCPYFITCTVPVTPSTPPNKPTQRGLEPKRSKSTGCPQVAPLAVRPLPLPASSFRLPPRPIPPSPVVPFKTTPAPPRKDPILSIYLIIKY